jgi:hypothetical protein
MWLNRVFFLLRQLQRCSATEAHKFSFKRSVFVITIALRGEAFSNATQFLVPTSALRW